MFSIIKFNCVQINPILSLLLLKRSIFNFAVLYLLYEMCAFWSRDVNYGMFLFLYFQMSCRHDWENIDIQPKAELGNNNSSTSIYSSSDTCGVPIPSASAIQNFTFCEYYCN